jgi:hypothetical protein
MVVDRKGSVGGEVMKRFTVVLIKKQSNVLKRTGIIVHLLVIIKVVLRSSKWIAMGTGNSTYGNRDAIWL